MLARLLPVLALTAASVCGQQLCLAEGSLTDLQIVNLAENNLGGGDTVVLQHIEFLPIELTGRTIARDGDAGRSRWAEVGGIQRVELPGGGRLLRYVRLAGQFYGFLHVAAGGAATIVLERAGVGATLDDPFAATVAVADDGLHAAVAGANGGLDVMRLDGGVFVSTGRPDRRAVSTATDIEPLSLMVGPAHAFFLTDNDELFRCALADGGSVDDLTPPAVPGGFWKPELAMAGDGASVAGLYGASNSLMRIYRADTVGATAVPLTAPGRYEEPNYLPLGAGAPSMLLNDDGSRLFFVDGQVRDELWLLDTTGVLPSLQITEDQIFEPYIGVYILPKFRGTQLIAAIGDLAAMDWYAVDLTPAGGAVANLTNTGTPLQPYFPGTLDPRAALDAGNRRVVVEGLGAGMVARQIDLATGQNVVLRQDSTLTAHLGGAFAGAPDLVLRGAGGDALHLGGTGALLGATPAGIGIATPVRGPVVSATWVHLAGTLGITAYYIGGAIIPGNLAVGVQQIVMTQQGGIVTNTGSVHYVAVGIDTVLTRPAVAVRWVLSGVGG